MKWMPKIDTQTINKELTKPYVCIIDQDWLDVESLVFNILTLFSVN